MKSGLQTLPRRVDSLVASKGPYFAEVEEELRDIKRVNAQGQEEDLRLALGLMISRVEELTSMLKEAFKAQTDLQTELTLAKSNLQLQLANNEMLEDALKRTGHVKDVGWRRWSAREQKERDEEDRRRSMDSAGSFDTAQNSPIPHPSPMPPSPLPNGAAVVSPVPSSDGRFFKFRFGSGSATTSYPSSPRLGGVNGTKSPLPSSSSSHLTSASLPSLVPARELEKEIEELNAELKREREARNTVISQKDALEAELESLSQALFEEANKMVSTERKKLAETEDELKELQAEREALRNALRLVERQSRLPDSAPYPESGHAHTPSTSSARAVKSLPSSRPSTPESPNLEGEEDPTSAGTVVGPYVHRPPPIMVLDSPLVSSSPPPDEELQHPDVLDSRQTTLQGDESASRSSSLKPSPLPSPSSSGIFKPSPSPSPSIASPEIGDYVYPLMRPLDYLPGEVSPWADVPSIGSPQTR